MKNIESIRRLDVSETKATGITIENEIQWIFWKAGVHLPTPDPEIEAVLLTPNDLVGSPLESTIQENVEIVLPFPVIDNNPLAGVKVMSKYYKQMAQAKIGNGHSEAARIPLEREILYDIIAKKFESGLAEYLYPA